MAESAHRRKQIFLQAVELSLSERAPFLDRECAGDKSLRRDIDALLQAHGQPDSFLEKPAAMGLTVDAADALQMANILPAAQIGTRIGPYKLLEQIGEGGMGVVYMAEQQEPVRRLVAIKIIKPGMDSGQVLARFEAERQALALMEHPNIARVLDAGTTQGEPSGVSRGYPYFVMELVKGSPITKFCDERRLSPRQRLELFVQVCQGIQHAHQKGVIHRDIKPSNVLIALYDDKPVPKVIDFGVAKAAGQPLTERTLHTNFGAVIGTPEYMSPEQATFNQLDIDTRSDVYALGVLLYELLTGTTPVDRSRFKEAAILALLRVVREEEPPRPSVKLSTLATKASVAATRGVEAKELARLLRGELDWVVMKSLEKDRNRRYESAADLARDVGRYLKDEPVHARPPSVVYRLRKFWTRHRGKVAVVLLSTFTVVTLSYFAWTFRDQRELAMRESALANASILVRLGSFNSADQAIRDAQAQGSSPAEIQLLRGQLAMRQKERNEPEEQVKYWRYPNAGGPSAGMGDSVFFGVFTTADSLQEVVKWYEERLGKKIVVDSPNNDGGLAGKSSSDGLVRRLWHFASYCDSRQPKQHPDPRLGLLPRTIKIGAATRSSPASVLTVVINRLEGEDATHIILSFVQK